MKSERDNLFSYYKESNFLRFKQFYLERDILRIAYTLFDAEKKLKSEGSIDNIIIPISKQTYKKIDVRKVEKILNELFLLILLEDIDIKLKEVDDINHRVTKNISFPVKEGIILFSGGVDSYAGIKVSENKYNNLLGLFVAHNDQPRIIKIVEQIKKEIKTEIRTLYAPGMGATGYSQFRGFLYILAGGVFLSLCKTDKILITECGPTMYQPMFSPFDSITYTTHPYIMKAAKEILEILLGYKIKLIVPFENLTKAEIISNSGIKDFSNTHSCISQRFGDHDGTCFGCVIKRLACVVVNVKDVDYNKDVFKENENQDNLMNLLSFCYDMIKNYNKMHYFQIDKIEEFDKHDLFKRYALDNLAGLMLEIKNSNPLYKKFRIEGKILKQRISDVRDNILKPNFNNCIN